MLVGQTQHVISFIFDIRSFTNFCKIEDSYNIANFVRRVYINVIKDYFPDATYYKPTGDGLLIIFRCPPKNVGEMTNSVVERSVKLVNDFPTFCKTDKLVYFKTPQNIGVGIYRGSACCISSENEIIDYSGKPLNLSARLSDMARPLGVVFDESVSSCVPIEHLTEIFQEENVYVKGLAEEETMKVYHTKNTSIPSAYMKPINEPEWTTNAVVFALENFQNGPDINRIKLTKSPIDSKEIILRASYPSISGSTTLQTWKMNDNPHIYYYKEGKEHWVDFSSAFIIKELDIKEEKVKSLTIEIIYPNRP